MDWLTLLKKAKKSCIVDDNLKKVRYCLEDGREMVEEYNLSTDVVTRRAWKNPQNLKGENEWDIELGDPEPKYVKESLLIQENSSQPFVDRRNTRINLEWRIRNLPYSLETYSVIADPENKCIIVKTTNKKYYKKLIIPELERLNILPEQENISFSHKYNTLIISYKKPKKLLEFEKALLQEVKLIEPKNYGDVNNCKPS